MPEYRYSAFKITSDKDGQEIIDDDFDDIDWLMVADDEDMARTTGNTRLINAYPELSLDDFSISVSNR